MKTKKLSSFFSQGDVCPCGKRVERSGVRFLCPDPVGHAQWQEAQELGTKQFTTSNPDVGRVQQSA